MKVQGLLKSQGGMHLSTSVSIDNLQGPKEELTLEQSRPSIISSALSLSQSLVECVLAIQVPMEALQVLNIP